MSCQRIKTHQRLYCDKPMRFSSVSFCEGSQTISCCSVLMHARCAFFWGVWRDMGLGFLLKWNVQFLNCKGGMSDYTTVSRESMRISYLTCCQVSSHLHFTYNYIAKKERHAVLHAYGCWSRTKWCVFFFLVGSLFCCGEFCFWVLVWWLLWWQEGGGNFLIDGYQILKDLEADPETRWLGWLGWEGAGETRKLPLFSIGFNTCSYGWKNCSLVC